ncbi:MULTISPECIES: hypothetical protein [unclassified Micromonospora]|uniref:hypothetical protein n=1 Tax=unclassified Micromonospora TaxID=2617518 RepID=UPI003A8A807F
MSGRSVAEVTATARTGGGSGSVSTVAPPLAGASSSRAAGASGSKWKSTQSEIGTSSRNRSLPTRPGPSRPGGR